MKAYKSKSGKESGVSGYSVADDKILVLFSNGHVYTYSYRSAGKWHVEQMKQLAALQTGLSTYIAQHQPGYE